LVSFWSHCEGNIWIDLLQMSLWERRFIEYFLHLQLMYTSVGIAFTRLLRVSDHHARASASGVSTMYQLRSVILIRYQDPLSRSVIFKELSPKRTSDMWKGIE